MVQPGKFLCSVRAGLKPAPTKVLVLHAKTVASLHETCHRTAPKKYSPILIFFLDNGKHICYKCNTVRMEKMRFPYIKLTMLMFLGLMLWVSGASAALSPLGGEFQVNTTTTGNQGSFSVGTDDAGNFVSAWTTPVTGDLCDTVDIFFQRFDFNGNKVGGEIVGPEDHVNGYQSRPNVAMDADGDFVIVWSEGFDIAGPCPATNPDGSSEGVFAQMYFSDGSTNGVPFQVNTRFTNTQESPVVAMNSTGDFVVAWRDWNIDAGEDAFNQWDVFAQLFDSAGNPVGSEQFVNQTIIGEQWDFDVSINDSQDWIVVWRGPDGDSDGVFARRYDSTGNPIEGEWQVNLSNTGGQFTPGVTLFNDGDFVVSWGHYISIGETYFQRFLFDGSRAGGEILAHPIAVETSHRDLGANKNTKDFFLVWMIADSDQWGVAGRAFFWTGAPSSNIVQINTTELGFQRPENRNAIGFSSSGKVTVVWQDDGGADGDGWGGFGQRYQVTAEPLVPVLSNAGILILGLSLMLLIYMAFSRMRAGKQPSL